MTKKLILFSILFIGFLQGADIQAQGLKIKKADSLFKKNDLLQASELYKQVLASPEPYNKEIVFFKLAYCNEKLGNFPQSLFFLYKYYNLNPSPKVKEKIDELASNQYYEGYNNTNISFFKNIYLRWYIPIIIIGLMLCGLFLYLNFKNRFKFRKRQLILFAFSTFLLLFLVNSGKFLKQGIIKDEVAFLRSSPSSSDNIVLFLKEGTKIRVLDKKDIWYRTLWNNQFYFIKQTDLYLID